MLTDEQLDELQTKLRWADNYEEVHPLLSEVVELKQRLVETEARMLSSLLDSLARLSHGIELPQAVVVDLDGNEVKGRLVSTVDAFEHLRELAEQAKGWNTFDDMRESLKFWEEEADRLTAENEQLKKQVILLSQINQNKR